jgi:flagellar biosynthesis protein FlhG
MTEALADQAAGLRRLIAPSGLRSVMVTAGSASMNHGVLTANLALALAAQGREVLLWDAASGERSCSWLLGANPTLDLMDAVAGTRGMDEVALRVRDSLRVVPASRFFGSWQRLRPQDLGRLADVLIGLSREADVSIVEAPVAAFNALPLAEDVALVARAEPDSITRSYRLLKRIAMDGGRTRAGVILQATQDLAHARSIFTNLASTCRQFIGMDLECLGIIPDDPAAQRAVALRQACVESFPESPGARAMRACADSLMLWRHETELSAHALAARMVSAVRSVSQSR